MPKKIARIFDGEAQPTCCICGDFFYIGQAVTPFQSFYITEPDEDGRSNLSNLNPESLEPDHLIAHKKCFLAKMSTKKDD